MAGPISPEIARRAAAAYAAGRKVILIAAELGISESSVKRHAARAGVAIRVRGAPRHIDRADLAARYRAGEKITDLAERYGATTKGVDSCLRLMGEPRTRRLGRRAGEVSR